MKRIKIPRCSVCDAVAQYESNRWPALLLCHPCHLKFMTYLNDKMADLIPDNPLVESLAVEDGFVWVQVDSSTCSQVYFRDRSEEHTSELQSLMRISYAVFCLNKKTKAKK